MRSIGARIVFAIAILAFARVASAQSVDDIIERSLTAQGGREALGKITSRLTKGTIVVSSPGGNLPGTIEVLNQAPNKVRTLINLDLTAVGAGSLTVDQRFDGIAGVSMDSMRGNTEITGDQLQNLRNNVFPTPLAGYKERGTKIVLTGREKVGSKDAYALSITPANGPTSRLWIDVQSYQPIKTASVVDAPGTGPLEQVTELSDFRDVDGVTVPFKLSTTTAVQSFTVTVTSVTHNPKIDPALFTNPRSNNRDHALRGSITP